MTVRHAGSCGVCAAVIPDGSDVCPRCGVRVAPPSAPPETTDLPTLLAGAVRAGSGPRVGAVLLDVVVGVLLAVPLVVGLLRGPGDDALATALAVVGAVLLVAYVVTTWVMHARTGRTLGRLALGLRTVDLFTGLPLGLARGPVGRWADAVVLDVRSGRDPARTVPDAALRPLAAIATDGYRPPTSPAPAAAPAPAPLAPQPPAGPAFAPTPAALPAPPAAAGSGAGSSAGAAGWTPPPPVAPIPATPTTPWTPGAVVVAIDDGQRFEIRGTALVGRNPQPAPDEQVHVLIPLNDLSRSVSKTHASLRWDGTVLWVADRGSTNGTRVVDPTGARTPVGMHGEQSVHPGSRIELGDRTVTVEVPAGSYPTGSHPTHGRPA
ncbi:RDD family protein [Cellulomonas fimi]|uniref:FHA domain-containing protein n=1 Tax=Cellulomonas fimi TaxID=1708 RepID=A0A7Y0QIU3_CELFI|nr:RDD family protein [Cellulomonas fimi]NMR21603.1 FHA domain-containing protein [Cellulomonas fimi]